MLVVVSGPPGAGKSTLAHRLARAIGCPAVCRDEIKEGMVHAAGEFTAAPGDELTLRTLPVFFGVVEQLLRAGVTTVAEAAFQDKVWRPHLLPLAGPADIRVVHCQVDAGTAFARIRRRQGDVPTRRAHDDLSLLAPEVHAARHEGFRRVRIEVPEIEVDTGAGYQPGLDEIVAFLNAARSTA